MHPDDEAHMRTAFELALKGYREGGCPIGGVLVDNTTGKILGKGHNALVQEGNPIVHGEMAAMRDAGRRLNRHDTTMYTTLQPCFMCTGMIVQFGIPRVVIADVVNAASDETIRFMRARQACPALRADGLTRAIPRPSSQTQSLARKNDRTGSGPVCGSPHAFHCRDFHLIFLAGLPAHSLEGCSRSLPRRRSACFEAFPDFVLDFVPESASA